MGVSGSGRAPPSLKCSQQTSHSSFSCSRQRTCRQTCSRSGGSSTSSNSRLRLPNRSSSQHQRAVHLSKLVAAPRQSHHLLPRPLTALTPTWSASSSRTPASSSLGSGDWWLCRLPKLAGDVSEVNMVFSDGSEEVWDNCDGATSTCLSGSLTNGKEVLPLQPNGSYSGAGGRGAGAVAASSAAASGGGDCCCPGSCCSSSQGAC